MAKPPFSRLAMAAGAVVGSLAFQPTAAMAASSCWFGVSTNGFSECAPNSILSIGDKQLTFLNSPNLSFGGATGTVNLNYIPGPELYTVNVDFQPDGSSNNKSGKMAYEFKVIKPGYEFESVKLTANSVNPTTSITKTTIQQPGGSSVVLASANGLTDGPKAIGGTVINVLDEWSTNTSGVLDSFTNTYTQRRSHVPGPVPLLGAGAAFGFSRRLRRRLAQPVRA